MAPFFCGRDTFVCDAYGIKSTKQFINTLSDNIRKRGAMDTLISDGGKYEISQQVTDLLRSLFIQDYQSEPIINTKIRLKIVLNLPSVTPTLS